MYCGNCGKQIEDNAKFCNYCGTKITGENAEDSIPWQQASNVCIDDNGGRGRKKKGKYVIALLVGLIVGGIYYFFAGDMFGRFGLGHKNRVEDNHEEVEQSLEMTQTEMSDISNQQNASQMERGEAIEKSKEEKIIAFETVETKVKAALTTLEIWDGSVAESFDGGDGSVENPYQISNGAQLAKLANDVNNGISFEGQNFIMSQDILLSDISNWDFKHIYNNTHGDFTSDGEVVYWWVPIGVYNRFMGSFDGKGHTIFGLYSAQEIDDVPYAGYFSGMGLFGHIRDTSVSNVNMVCSILKGSADSFGSIVGINEWSTVSNCSSEEMIIVPSGTCEEIGGIGGAGGDGSAYLNCRSSGVILSSVDSYLRGSSSYTGLFGGIAGKAENVDSCYSDVELLVTSFLSRKRDGEDEMRGITIDTGGIAGIASEISNCYNSGNVSLILPTSIWDDTSELSEWYKSMGVGGIAGSVTNCSNCGNSGTINALEDLPDWANDILHIDTIYSDTVEQIQPNYENYPNVYVGGISGRCRESISFCCSNQNVHTDIATGYTGGITGASGYSDDSVSVVNCVYKKADTSLDAVGCQTSRVFTDQIIGGIDSVLKDVTNYKNWDFVSTWEMDENVNQGFPYLITLVTFFE